MHDFAFKLIRWYEENKRDLPWRHTRDPYLIWLSEIILQQTRVSQGLPYYLRFVEALPSVRDFAAAQEQDILRLWQGLGYYSRARNMHLTAKFVVGELDGQFPSTYAALLKLKGIGPYTAAAIASFASEEEVAVVDGNVYRVLARLFGLSDDIGSPKGQKKFAELASDLLPKGQSQLRPSVYNQAIMEFGATHCKPSAPNCPACPFQTSCFAFAHKQQAGLPIKVKKVKTKQRQIQYVVFGHQGRLLMKPRGSGDIWQGLYDFPLVEGEVGTNVPPVLRAVLEIAQARPLQHLAVPSPVGDWPLRFVRGSGVYQHILTHQRLSATFLQVEIVDEHFVHSLAEQLGAAPYWPDEIVALPKPILIVKYLEDSFF